MIRYEKEIIEYLNLPSLPKKKWDGKSGFRDGVAVLEHPLGGRSYAVATFDPESDKEPRIKKVFGMEPYFDVSDIFVVPSYMNEDVEDFDLDDESKKAAQRLIEEAHELEMESVEEKKGELPEWVFDHIHNIDEAFAFCRDYRKRNRIKGALPKTEETLKAYLYVIYKDCERKNNRKRK